MQRKSQWRDLQSYFLNGTIRTKAALFSSGSVPFSSKCLFAGIVEDTKQHNNRYYGLRGSNHVPMEELVGEYRQILISYKKLEEYWKDLAPGGKIKVNLSHHKTHNSC